jgi:hypothetical protein
MTIFPARPAAGGRCGPAAARVLPKDPPYARTRLHLGGAGLIAVTQLLLTLPLLEGRDHEVRSPQALPGPPGL